MKLCDKSECLSCCACYAACPKNAISMAPDALGKLVPVINKKLCVDCGLCERSCPRLRDVKINYPRACFAGYTKNGDDINTCSSGGLATAMARHVAGHGGIAYGTLFRDQVLQFEKAEAPQDVQKFQGSKYVYSFPGKVFSEVKKDLISGRECLFIGLPCQIAGLRTFLGKEFSNLLTADLVCHGTPPLAYLEAHVQDLGYADAYGDIKFRGERNFFLTIVDQDGKLRYSRKQQEDEYFEAFMTGLIHRDCCYACPYACDKRVSDITIGDFWGIRSGALNGYKGRISCALVNTDKGGAFFKRLEDDLVLEAHAPEEAIRGNQQLQEPSRQHPKRAVFEQAYLEDGFHTAMVRTGLSARVKWLTVQNRILYIPRTIKRSIRKSFGK